MEDNVFPSEAVASFMKKHFVEARLHTDTQNTLTEEQFAKNREVQARVAESMSNPLFFVYDPKTGKEVAEFNLSGGFGTWEAKWLKFLKATVADAKR
ncbi:MAG: hypothetical protein AB8H80_22035 [Planctomycetota bacterium]